MNRKLLPCICAALCLCLCLCPVSAKADFGSFSGDSDYDYSDDSSWDSGYDYSDDSSWDGGYSSVSSPGGGSLPVPVIIIILAAVAYSLYARKQKAGRPAGGGGGRRLRPIDEYGALDPGFDISAFGEKVSNLYVQMQDCWQAKNIESLRPYLTDALYAQTERQLGAMRKRRVTNYVERITVMGVTPKGFYQAGGEDHIVAELRTRIVDYTLSDDTGELVSGSRSAEKFMTYEWDMSRTSGTLTAAKSEVKTTNCPNCGAPLSINETAKCPYCGSVVTVNEHDWVISGIKGVSQRTGGMRS